MGNKMKAYLVDFPPELIERCAEIAKERKLSRNAYIRECVTDGVNNYKQEDGENGKS